MNKEGRKVLSEISEKLSEFKDILEELQNDEQGKYDNMPESLQDSDKATTFEENAGTLGECVESLDEIINKLGEL